MSVKLPRPPPGTVKSGPIAAACTVALAYYAFSVHYRTSDSAANSTKSVPWWKPSN